MLIHKNGIYRIINEHDFAKYALKGYLQANSDTLVQSEVKTLSKEEYIVALRKNGVKCDMRMSLATLQELWSIHDVK